MLRFSYHTRLVDTLSAQTSRLTRPLQRLSLTSLTAAGHSVIMAGCTAHRSLDVDPCGLHNAAMVPSSTIHSVCAVACECAQCAAAYARMRVRLQRL